MNTVCHLITASLFCVTAAHTHNLCGVDGCTRTDRHSHGSDHHSEGHHHH